MLCMTSRSDPGDPRVFSCHVGTFIFALTHTISCSLCQVHSPAVLPAPPPGAAVLVPARAHAARAAAGGGAAGVAAGAVLWQRAPAVGRAGG